MNKMFTQSTGPVAKQVNKQTIARIFGIKNTEVGYLKEGVDVSGYKVLFDPTTQLCFWRGSASGTPTTWSISGYELTLVTSVGSYTLTQAKAGDYIRVNTLEDLRKLEPSFNGQVAILYKAIADGPVLNEFMTYNPIPSDAIDDGYSRFVTAGGKVWDTDIKQGHNVFLAGYSDSLNNLAECWNKIIQDKVSKVISRGFVAGGVGASIRIPPNPRADGATVFKITESIRHPSFIASYLPENCILDASEFTTGPAIIGSNEFTGLTNTMLFLNNGGGWGSGAGASSGHPEGGIFGRGTLIKGPNTDSSPALTTSPGVRWGNVSYPSTYMHFRDSHLFDVKVSGFAEGIRFASVDTYIANITNCYFTKNDYGVTTLTPVSGGVSQFSNSGEKIVLTNCVIGDNRKGAIYMDSLGHFLTFRDCSIDYNAGDVVLCSPRNIGKCYFYAGHVEGNSGLLLNCPTRTTTSGENNVKFFGSVIYLNTGTTDTYGGVRTVVYGTTIRTVLALVDCDIFCRAPYVNGAYSALKGYDPTNLARISVVWPNSGQTYRFLPSYDGQYGNRINNVLLFTGTAGANVPTGQATGDFYCIKSGSAQCVYGSSADADSDGLIPIKITLTASTESVQLYMSQPVYPDRATQYAHGYCSVKVGAATGAVNVSALARAIKSVTGSVTAAPGTVTNTETLYGINSSTSQDIIASLAQSTISITANDYMGTRPLAVQMTGGIYSYLGFTFTGFVGDIYVKLPVWMFSDRTPNFGYI